MRGVTLETEHVVERDSQSSSSAEGVNTTTVRLNIQPEDSEFTFKGHVVFFWTSNVAVRRRGPALCLTC